MGTIIKSISSQGQKYLIGRSKDKSKMAARENAHTTQKESEGGRWAALNSK